MLRCCEKCHKWNNCVRKWILAQKNLEETCCAECAEFSKCLEANRLDRWKIIHGDNSISPRISSPKCEALDLPAD